MRWKRTRYEVMAGVGVSNFMGDLGGSTSNRSNYNRYFGDFDFSATRPTIALGARYKIYPVLSAKLNLMFGFLRGADRYSLDYGRTNRDLEFYSEIYEQSVVLEYHIIKENTSRRWSSARKKKIRGFSVNLYVFGGIGGFYFSPKAEFNGKTYRLRKLGTEGQTVEGSGKKKYSPYSMCVPGGLGMKVGINRKWDVELDYGIRWTLTDYIDDTGGDYYDNAAIIKANGGGDSETGKAAGWLADNHKGGQRFNEGMYYNNGGRREYREEYAQAYQPGDRVPYPSGTTTRSGNSNDYYMFFTLSLSYKLRTGRNGLPKF